MRGGKQKKSVTKANKLFRQNQYKEAERYYKEAKEHFATCRKECNKIPTSMGQDFLANWASYFVLFVPFLNVLVLAAAIVAEGSYVGDSNSRVNMNKVFEECSGSSSLLKNYIMTLCRKVEIACDDKIKRCQAARK